MLRWGLLLLVLASQATAEERPQGLLWSETDLPRTMPLQIKSAPDRDLYIVLRDAMTGQDVMGAYAQGGEFFRLLVPPGRFELQVALGPAEDWKGGATLFGPDTERLRLDPPLDFGVTGFARKGGHLVDLSDLGAIAQKSLGICQRLALDFDSVTTAPEAVRPGVKPRDPMEIPEFPVPKYRRVDRICD
ncbi:hypothetical protein BMG03_11730 [Thioclava nitratireducens]|uniref:DUF2846 domain-containing protein n=1 Tax=Thioclava nitratireducens TaxID=1915078 RepID=A0ABN4XFQ5_9RHOB|nr:hypothetical protein [Thioclava nitratireducens]AQS48391.1 hypothetical protein BMG03_11730 [Thioclava nitratireducens]